MMVWKSLGYYTLLVLAALQSVPKDIYEAAEIDDTPKIKTFFKITIPMISPTLFFTTIVATISSFQVFETVNLMTQGEMCIRDSLCPIIFNRTSPRKNPWACEQQDIT